MMNVCLSFIQKLRPVTYQFDRLKYDNHLVHTWPDSMRQQHMAEINQERDAEPVQTGFIAQEVEQACKDLNYTFSGLHVPENESDNYGIAYGSFVPLLVKGIQEQQAEIKELKTQLEKLAAQNEMLMARAGIK